jgi:hypothetical protein
MATNPPAVLPVQTQQRSRKFDPAKCPHVRSRPCGPGGARPGVAPTTPPQTPHPKCTTLYHTPCRMPPMACACACNCPRRF